MVAESNGLTVGAVADLAGVTVRTLHHYDEIGLISPSERSSGGYRLYGPAEMERLQEVLFFRELGFGLAEIQEIVNRPGYRRRRALVRQRRMLLGKQERLAAMVSAIDKVIESERMGVRMDADEMLEVFGDFDPGEYAAEAEERWGTTDAYAQSRQRTAGYTKQDWESIKSEADAINRGLLELMAAGVPADGDAAQELAEAHRAHIGKWFYDCPHEMHAGLGRMYVTDMRFKESIDAAGSGLAEYLAAAIAANAAG